VIRDLLRFRYADLDRQLRAADGDVGLRASVWLRMEIISELTGVIRDLRPTEEQMLDLVRGLARGAPYLLPAKRRLARDEATQLLESLAAPSPASIPAAA